MSLTPKQAAARVRSLNAVIDRTVVRALNKALEDGKQDALEYSSGYFSSKDLAKRDHPFARRHGSPLLPTEIINEQSGEFKGSWRIERVIMPGEGGQLINDSKVADFLQYGTKTMFDRPIVVVLVKKIADHAEKRLNEAGRQLGTRYG